MTEEKDKQATTAPAEKATEATASRSAAGGGVGSDDRRQNKKNRRGGRKGGRGRERQRSEYDQKIISIRRVTRVVAGGRRFSFSVALVMGNRKGSVGVGVGKAGDTALAIEKAMRNAKKNMVKVNLTKEMRIPHYTSAKYCASNLIMLPSPGKGLVAGSSVRNVLELAGVKDVSAKVLSRSKNKLNNARAAMKALDELKS